MMPAILTILVLAGTYPAVASERAGSPPSMISEFNWHAEFAFSASTADQLPHWHTFNRGGRFGPRQTDGWFIGRIDTDWTIPENNRVRTNPPYTLGAPSHPGGGPVAEGGHMPLRTYDPVHPDWYDAEGRYIRPEVHQHEDGSFPVERDYEPWYTWRPDYRVGMEFLGKSATGESKVYEIFAQLRYGPFEFTGGRKSYTIGFQDDRLSTGSLAVSSNFAPMPRLTLGIPEYIPVPFTFGFFEFRGQYTHGWFTDDRFMDTPRLHEKSLYVRSRSDWPVELRGGFTHLAMWGGEHPELGSAPRDFKDYLRVVLGRGGYTDDPADGRSTFPSGSVAKHIGVMEGGLALSYGSVDWDFYRQSFFTGGDPFRFFTGSDGLQGVRVQPRDNPWVRAILIEYLRLSEDYYDHAGYTSGWAYRDHAMGTSMILRGDRSLMFYPDIPFDEARFVNNRVRALHMGFEGNIGGPAMFDTILPEMMSDIIHRYRLLFTRASHRGTYEIGLPDNQFEPENGSPMAPFEENPVQYHMMVELSGSLPWVDGLSWTGSVSLDTGDMTDQAGFLLGIRFGDAVGF
ncbi:capsule assembly Wzi family protein [Natronogracilivirga saccharolytica]|uniref:Capsule assembly Wzi family protein n=1 Tax=Natronogracilivirga saccharolytica TaxID=2812953 RepID=A0A8J7RQU5_9BACT|nr:capsule assembly Wzi family protein [Natronogracilivirga saccharolytica]MBP3192299.1 hypothetical protein [Natronogracilivirga saccharolytica]